MILAEQSTVPLSALPMAALRDHLRLGTGFADDAVQDGVLESCLRSALAAIEARTGKVLFQRDFLWTLAAWRDLQRQALPVAPATAILRVAIVDRLGAETVADPGSYLLERDAHRPALTSAGLCLPTIPVGGRAEIAFAAGYGADWEGIPPDLRQAVLRLAGHAYETRLATGREVDGFPPAVNELLMPYLNIRLFGGGRR